MAISKLEQLGRTIGNAKKMGSWNGVSDADLEWMSKLPNIRIGDLPRPVDELEKRAKARETIRGSIYDGKIPEL